MKKLILGLAALMFLAGTAAASEWNFYGSTRVKTFYTKVDNAAAATTKNLDMGLTAEAVVGATVKASDTVEGFFEYGSENGTVTARYLYGTWNFGAGTLLVGKDDGPLALPGSDQVYGDDAGLGGWGEMSSQKKAQLRLTFGSFQVAARQPDVNYNDGTSNVTANTEVKMPSLEARYDIAGDIYNLAANAGYYRFKVGPSPDQTITSWVVGTGGDLAVGPWLFGANIFAGENVGNLIDADVNGGDTGKGYARYSGGRVTDNKAFGWKITATWTVSDRVSLHAGYGYLKTELTSASKDDVKSYYLQCPVTLAPGVFVVPEIGTVDYIQNTAANKTTYAGAKWQIEF